MKIKTLGDFPLLNKIRGASTYLIVPLSFILPISMLYFSNPDSFELIWHSQGRAPYVIFLWLLLLELALAWKKIANKWPSIVAMAITIVAPTYLTGIFAFALKDEVMELGKLVGAPYLAHGEWILESWALSIEYVVLTICFVISIWLVYKNDSFKIFSVSMFFLGATSCFHMIDTFYPFGTLTVPQAFATVTASSAVQVLNWIGYEASISGFHEGMPILYVAGLPGPRPVIGWPCAGVQSLFIYTFVIMLFLKVIHFSLPRRTIRACIPKRLKLIFKTKATDFLLERKITRAVVIAAEMFIVTVLKNVPLYMVVVIGAIGTYIVNVVRIVSFCIIGVNTGRPAADFFHRSYGEWYFMIWIIAYILAIIYGGRILTKLSTLASKTSRP